MTSVVNLAVAISVDSETALARFAKFHNRCALLSQTAFSAATVYALMLAIDRLSSPSMSNGPLVFVPLRWRPSSSQPLLLQRPGTWYLAWQDSCGVTLLHLYDLCSRSSSGKMTKCVPPFDPTEPLPASPLLEPATLLEPANSLPYRFESARFLARVVNRRKWLGGVLTSSGDTAATSSGIPHIKFWKLIMRQHIVVT